jgi:hypothetical protein
MEENLKDKPEEEKLSKPPAVLKPGGPGITITPVSSPPPQPTTPLPRVALPPSFRPLPKTTSEEKRERTSLLLLLIIILNIFSLWMLILIGFDKIPGFLVKP